MRRRLLIDSRVLEFAARLKKRDRNFLFLRFEAIRDFPANHIDYRHRDETGREFDGHIADRFAILFWDDLADGHLKIMDVAWADKT